MVKHNSVAPRLPHVQVKVTVAVIGTATCATCSCYVSTFVQAGDSTDLAGDRRLVPPRAPSLLSHHCLATSHFHQATATRPTWRATADWCWTTSRTPAAPTCSRQGMLLFLAASSLTGSVALMARLPHHAHLKRTYLNLTYRNDDLSVSARLLLPLESRSRIRSGGRRWLPSATRAWTSASTLCRRTACARCAALARVQ